MCKSLKAFFIVLAVLCFCSSTAIADVSVGIEIPLSYSFKDADDGGSLEADGMPSGFILTAQLPLLSLGVGLESYEIALDGNGDNSIALNMVDVFYVLPIPIVDVALGLGYGNVELKGDDASDYESTACTQYFLRLGVPIGTMFQITASYHNVFARVKSSGSDDLLEAGGTMTTIGVSVGF
jgi:hypothetical protein